MTIKFIDDGNPDGHVLGQTATTKIGFFGTATPIARPASTTATTTTAATSASGVWGYASSAQANTLSALVAQLHADIIALGLKSS